MAVRNRGSADFARPFFPAVFYRGSIAVFYRAVSFPRFSIVAQKGYGSIAHEAKPNGLLTRGP